MTETISPRPIRSVLDQIRYRPTGYKPIEARIAAAILENPDSFTRESIVAFAQRTAVSTGSVVRFAQSFGFSGYSGLKVAVARETPQVLPLPDPAFDPYRSPFATRMDDQIRALVAASRDIDPGTVSRAARLLAKARNVDFVATGASTSIAQLMLFSLTVVGIRARYLPDSVEHAAAAALLGKEDALVAISFSGRTRGTVDAAARAGGRRYSD